MAGLKGRAASVFASLTLLFCPSSVDDDQWDPALYDPGRFSSGKVTEKYCTPFVREMVDSRLLSEGFSSIDRQRSGDEDFSAKLNFKRNELLSYYDVLFGCYEGNNDFYQKAKAIWNNPANVQEYDSLLIGLFARHYDVISSRYTKEYFYNNADLITDQYLGDQDRASPKNKLLPSFYVVRDELKAELKTWIDENYQDLVFDALKDDLSSFFARRALAKTIEIPEQFKQPSEFREGVHRFVAHHIFRKMDRVRKGELYVDVGTTDLAMVLH